MMFWLNMKRALHGLWEECLAEGLRNTLGRKMMGPLPKLLKRKKTLDIRVENNNSLRIKMDLRTFLSIMRIYLKHLGYV